MNSSDNRPAFTFCLCPDSELIRDYIRRRLADSGQAWKRSTFWGDEELPDTFWEAMTWNGLLGENRAIVLRRAEKCPESVWKALNSVLNRFRKHIWPFICIEGNWERGKPPVPSILGKQKYWQLAKEKRWIWQSAGLNRDSLREYLKDWTRRKGLEMPSDVFYAAVNILPLDASALFHELDKLELYSAEKKRVDNKDLQVLSFNWEMDIFAFLQALQNRDRDLEVWRQVFHSQLGSGSDMLLPFLALMLREARTLWQLSCGEAEKLRLPSRVKQEKIRLAANLGQTRLAHIWTLLLEAETGLKSGDRNADQALELLISRLMELFS